MGLRDMSRAAFNLALHDISKRTKHPVLWTYIYNLFADEQKAAADAVDLPKECKHAHAFVLVHRLILQTVIYS
jgi:hypothetical protein